MGRTSLSSALRAASIVAVFNGIPASAASVASMRTGRSATLAAARRIFGDDIVIDGRRCCERDFGDSHGSARSDFAQILPVICKAARQVEREY